MIDKDPLLPASTNAKKLSGIVTKCSSDKTIKVSVEWKKLHKTGRYIPQTTVYLVHDESNQCSPGDMVFIRECRPFSKQKHMILDTIIAKTGDK